MEIDRTGLDGCYIVRPFRARDDRGKFVKTYNCDSFASFGLQTEWSEEYVSVSKKNVIRGMHFQSPPHEHSKLVYCLRGKALDVVVDLRRSSCTYGKYFKIELDADDDLGLYIPRGFAHGFLALDNDTTMQYKVSSVYAPENDMGIRWDSFGLDWEIACPILSKRDREHPMLNEFESPFYK